MALVVPDAAESLILEMALNKTAAENQLLKLFINDVTPIEGHTEANYTEMSTQGYVAKSLTGSSWTLTQGNPTVAEYAQQTWTFDGTGGETNVYGYFVVQASSGAILWVERFFENSYFIIANNGDTIKVTPRLTGE
jgi:hypothetical protein